MSDPTRCTIARMISSSRQLALLLLAVCTVTAAAPQAARRAAQAPASAAASAPDAASQPIAVRIERFVDRVWVVDAATGVAPGSVYVFLSDNVLVTSPKGGSPSVGTWAEDVDGLVLTEKGRSSKVAVLELNAERFRFRIKGAKALTEVTLVPAIKPEPPPPVPTAAAPAGAAAPAAAAPAPAPVAAPVGAPYRCGGDTFRVAFDEDKAFLTWPDNTVVVLREVKVADSGPSRRTYTDGQLRLVEDTSESFTRVLFARPGFRPRPCSSTR
jgi:hypothetical protein